MSPNIKPLARYVGKARRFRQALELSITWPKPRLPEVRPITDGPHFHWFGYYDKLQMDPSGRFVLGMEVDFEHRSPRPEDVLRIGMVDLQDGRRWIHLGETTSWSWQQGCMLQWLPNSSSEILWNDRCDDGFICRVLNLDNRTERILPMPVYAVSPDASWAITTDYSALTAVRPGYGYAATPGSRKPTLAPDETGIWRGDLASGKVDLILTLAQVCQAGAGLSPRAESVNWLDHLLVSPDGSRFAFLHRWRRPEHAPAFSSRLLTANADGSGLHVADPHGHTSHYIWRDPRHLLAWAWNPWQGHHFYLFRDRSSETTVVAPKLMNCDGHCTYLRNPRWILCDTYPHRFCPYQNLYLVDAENEVRYPLGHFHAPSAYDGEWRCDLHPRSSSDGTRVIIDSAHGGSGRQMHLIDISSIVA